MSTEGTGLFRGPLAWMAKNGVAANLLMIAVLIGGFFMAQNIKQEVFPEFDLDVITVSVAYPGANPSEVEEGILLVIEENVQGIDGVKTVTATASEGVGTVSVELLEGADAQVVLADIKNSVDRISSFPEDAERPVISQATMKRQVISLVVHGNIPEENLRQLAEQMRYDLLASDAITQVELDGVKSREISIEITTANLRAYGLTLDQVAAAIQAGSVELSSGSMRTSGGEILIRTTEKRNYGSEFEDITILAGSSGTQVRLGDIATVTDGFEDSDSETTFNGEPAIRINVYRVGDQTPSGVASAVKAYMEVQVPQLPTGVGLAVWDDRSEILEQRMDLLLNNAAIGLALVFIILGLFLELRLAFWVMLGIPISFLGSMLLMPSLDVSINMISLFAFIVVLGIVVDDAIVVGENVYHKRQQGLPRLQAAIEGVKGVSMPVVFAVLTSVAAFVPLLLVPGTMGKVFSVIPVIVISVLLWSLVESLFILPAHLAHSKKSTPGGLMALIRKNQRRIAEALDRFVDTKFRRFVKMSTRNRYTTVAVALALLFIMGGFAGGGHLEFIFFPKVEGDNVRVDASLPVGSPVEETRVVRDQVLAALNRVMERHGGAEHVSRGVYIEIGQSGRRGHSSSSQSGGHIMNVAVRLIPSDERDFGAPQLTREWRSELGQVPNIETISFNYNMGPASDAAVTIELMHSNTDILETAAQELAAAMAVYDGLTDIDSGVAGGKTQLDLQLKPAARTLGLTERNMARQLRSAFYGAEALRQQRGRDEVKVVVRLPEEDRRRLYGFEQFRFRTPSGREIPLEQAATVTTGRAYTTIERQDGNRILEVTADVDENRGNANRIVARIQQEVLPGLMDKYPGLRYSLEGIQKDQAESMTSLLLGFAGALLMIYALLAIPFGSYVQPFVVMSSIPFGIIGAVLGHLLLGYELSIMSGMGIVALSGVVVNDSLVLIVSVNEFRKEGMSAFDAVISGGIRRFRPIIMTSLTTFFGLAPIIMETSLQARFLIPMAISLGFGVLFATGIVLILVPSIYMVLEDIKGLLGSSDSVDENGDTSEKPAAVELESAATGV